MNDAGEPSETQLYRDGEQPTAYFSSLVGEYTAHRPSYAEAAMDAVLAGFAPPIDVVSVGCGTGICCRQLAQRGARVIGIDPNEAMRSAAERAPLSAGATGSVFYCFGEAEATDLPDGCCDVVVCAQSFHWFDERRALPEFHRILRANGRLALLWNVRSEHDDFTRGYESIVRRSQAMAEAEGRTVERNRNGDPTVTGHFVLEREATFDNPQPMDLERLLGRLRSASYFPQQGEVREAMLNDARALFARDAVDGKIALGQATRVVLARRLESRL